MQAIKSLVIFMGLLLVAGLGLLGYGMYSKAGRAVKTSSPAQGTVRSGELPQFGAVWLGQPAGSRIVSSQLADGMATLVVTGGGMEDRLLVIDALSGKSLGQVSLGVAPAVPAAHQE